MLVLLLVLISFIGIGVITRMEMKRSITQPRTFFMGQWPYNIVLLIGVSISVLVNDTRFEPVIQWGVIAATIVFYAVTFRRLSET